MTLELHGRASKTPIKIQLHYNEFMSNNTPSAAAAQVHFFLG